MRDLIPSVLSENSFLPTVLYTQKKQTRYTELDRLFCWCEVLKHKKLRRRISYLEGVSFTPFFVLQTFKPALCFSLLRHFKTNTSVLEWWMLRDQGISSPFSDLKSGSTQKYKTFKKSWIFTDHYIYSLFFHSQINTSFDNLNKLSVKKQFGF